MIHTSESNTVQTSQHSTSFIIKIEMNEWIPE